MGECEDCGEVVGVFGIGMSLFCYDLYFDDIEVFRKKLIILVFVELGEKFLCY